MTDKSLKLIPKRALHSDGVQKTLQSAQDLVGNETITAMAIVAIDSEGCVYWMYEPGESYSTLIGGMERLQFRIMMRAEND